MFVLSPGSWTCNYGIANSSVSRWQILEQHRFVVEEVKPFRWHCAASNEPCVRSQRLDGLETPLDVLAPLFQHLCATAIWQGLHLKKVLHIMSLRNFCLGKSLPMQAQSPPLHIATPVISCFSPFQHIHWFWRPNWLNVQWIRQSK